MRYAVYGWPVIQYTGNNSAEVLAAFEEAVLTTIGPPTITFISEIEGVLKFHSDYDGQNLITTLNAGEWTIVDPTGKGNAIIDFETRYFIFPE